MTPTRPRILFALAALLIAVPFRSQPVLQSVPPVGAPGCSGALNPDVVLCDDFESGGFETLWDIGSNAATWPSAQFVRCEEGFGYKDRCAAWSNDLLFDTYWGYWGYDAWRAFPPQPEFYVRWYEYISDPYVWGTLEDKSLMLHDPIGSITAYVASSRNHLPVEANSGPGVPYLADYQDLDWPETGNQYTRVNRFQNQGNNITLQPGRWYLFEWYIKMNTPGLSDGATRLWIDDATEPVISQTLRLQYDDMRWLRSTDAGKGFSFLRLTAYNQRCDILPSTCPPNGPAILRQSQRWDRIAVSRQPIGPIPSAPVCDGAEASPKVLWPPDHRLVPVAIQGVTHPGQDPVSITIVKVTVTPDEPVRALGRRGHELDAIIRGDYVLLRAERTGAGSGRTYTVSFVARDPHGGQCTGAAAVRVPHRLRDGRH